MMLDVDDDGNKVINKLSHSAILATYGLQFSIPPESQVGRKIALKITPSFSFQTVASI